MAGRRPVPPLNVTEYPLDDVGVFDADLDPHGAVALLADFKVDLEHPFQSAQTLLLGGNPNWKLTFMPWTGLAHQTMIHQN